MHSVNGFIERLFGGRQSPRPGTPGRSIVDGTETQAWTKRPVMNSHAFYADKNKRAAKPKTNSDWDARDYPKYGVVASRPYSTPSKHGTGRGSQV
jgi:hypothetical protein